LINPRKPEGVLGAVLVEVGVVDAHPPLVRVLLADEDGVGEPLRTGSETRTSSKMHMPSSRGTHFMSTPEDAPRLKSLSPTRT
jgi:hypothetical protein